MIINQDGKIPMRLKMWSFKILQNDEEKYGIKSNRVCNKIFEEFYNRKDEENRIDKGKKKIFNLNKKNKLIFSEYIKGSNKTNSEAMRGFIEEYCNLPFYKREKILMRDEVKILERAIKKGRKVKIKYSGGERVISPYFIEYSKEEEFNYIFSWCDKNSGYRNYRLSHIMEIVELREEKYSGDEEYIKNIKENFDPFLSYGHIVKIKMNDNSINKFNRISHNRPKVLDKGSDGIWEFECLPFKAIIYFSQFAGEVEILEPQSVRENMIEHYKKALEIYT